MAVLLSVEFFEELGSEGGVIVDSCGGGGSMVS